MADQKQMQPSTESEPDGFRDALRAQSDFDEAMEKLEQELWSINDELIGDVRVEAFETDIEGVGDL